MDVLGMRAIAKSMRGVGQEPPPADELHALALAGDMAGNSLYYSLVAAGKPEGALLCGTILGLAAGVGAVLLPEPLGLGDAPSARTPETKAMTIGWYLAGGLAAAFAYRMLAGGAGAPGRRTPSGADAVNRRGRRLSVPSRSRIVGGVSA
jgi:hypothetical protein